MSRQRYVALARVLKAVAGCIPSTPANTLFLIGIRPMRLLEMD